MTRTYDQDYRPIAIHDASLGGWSLGFGYDAVGNLTKLGTAGIFHLFLRDLGPSESYRY